MSVQSNGDALVLLAAAVSLQLVRGHTPEELELMAAFFTALGDNLALWLTRLPQNTDTGGGCNSGGQPCK